MLVTFTKCVLLSLLDSHLNNRIAKQKRNKKIANWISIVFEKNEQPKPQSSKKRMHTPSPPQKVSEGSFLRFVVVVVLAICFFGKMDEKIQTMDGGFWFYR